MTVIQHPTAALAEQPPAVSVAPVLSDPAEFAAGILGDMFEILGTVAGVRFDDGDRDMVRVAVYAIVDAARTSAGA